VSEGVQEQLTVGEKFKEFLRSFKDATGLKYMNRIHRMMNLDMTSLLVDYPDLYRHDPELAVLLVDNPRPVLKQFDDALKEVDRRRGPRLR